MINQLKIKKIFEAARNDEKILNDLLEDAELLKDRFKLSNSDIEKINSHLNQMFTNKELARHIFDNLKKEDHPFEKPIGPWDELNSWHANRPW